MIKSKMKIRNKTELRGGVIGENNENRAQMVG